MVEPTQNDIPELSGKDMNALMYLLLSKVGTVRIPQEVFDTAPGPEILQIERQWDEVNSCWYFFVKHRVGKKPLLMLPSKNIIANRN